MELVTSKAGRWWSRLRRSRRLGDARRQPTAPQVGRGGRWPPGRRILGLGLVVVVLGGLWGIAAGGQPVGDAAMPAGQVEDLHAGLQLQQPPQQLGLGVAALVAQRPA